MCFVKSVVLFLEVCCLFRYICYLVFYMKKVLTPMAFFFSWRRIHFDIVSAFSSLENYEQERYTDWCITLDRIESVEWCYIIVIELLLVLWFLKYPVNIVYITNSLVTVLKRWFEKNIVCSPYVILFNEFLKWNGMMFFKNKNACIFVW